MISLKGMMIMEPSSRKIRDPGMALASTKFDSDQTCHLTSSFSRGGEPDDIGFWQGITVPDLEERRTEECGEEGDSPDGEAGGIGECDSSMEE